MAADRILLFDAADRYQGELVPSEVYGRTRVLESNGEHTLTIVTTRALEVGTRVLTRDGAWHEWVVEEPDQEHAEGRASKGTYRCVRSAQHDLAGVVSPTHHEPGIGSACSGAEALRCALDGTTRWTVGDVDVSDVAAGNGVVMASQSAWERLSLVRAAWGGYVTSEVEVDGTRVTARRIGLRAIGDISGGERVVRRFDFGADVLSIHRKPDPGPYYSRVWPLGKGQTEYADADCQTTWTWRQGVAEENGGRPYVGRSDLEEMLRVPAGDLAPARAELAALTPACEDLEALEANAKQAVGSAESDVGSTYNQAADKASSALLSGTKLSTTLAQSVARDMRSYGAAISDTITRLGSTLAGNEEARLGPHAGVAGTTALRSRLAARRATDCSQLAAYATSQYEVIAKAVLDKAGRTLADSSATSVISVLQTSRDRIASRLRTLSAYYVDECGFLRGNLAARVTMLSEVVETGWEHPTKYVTYDQCEYADELLEKATDDLDRQLVGGCSYEVRALVSTSLGRSMAEAVPGEPVQVVDLGFFAGVSLRLLERVARVEVDDLRGVATVTVGNVREGIGAKVANLAKATGVTSLSGLSPLTPTLLARMETAEIRAQTIDPVTADTIDQLQQQVAEQLDTIELQQAALEEQELELGQQELYIAQLQGITEAAQAGSGTAPIVRDGDGNAYKVTVGTDEEGNPTTELTKVVPAGMKVQLPPFKIDYYDGEEIDYFGLTCLVLCDDGVTPWVDDRYPFGVIPIPELELPVTVAKAVGPDLGDTPRPLAGALVSTIVYRRNGKGPYTYTYMGDGVYTIHRLDGTAQHHIHASRERDATMYASTTSGYDYRLVLSNSYTYAGKTVWYAATEGDPVDEIISITPTYTGNADDAEVAWCIAYGAQGILGGDEIPVRWTSPYDGSTYTDKFDITIFDAGGYDPGLPVPTTPSTGGDNDDSGDDGGDGGGHSF